MACNITIDGIEVLAFAAGFPTSIRVFGSAADCKVVDVFIECPDGTSHSDSAIVDFSGAGGSWEVTFVGDGLCRCDELLKIKAVCKDNPNCSAGGEFVLECREHEEQCPVISAQVTIGDCINGMRPVTVSGDAANLGATPAEFVIEFAPGVVAGPIVAPAGAITPYGVTHNYPANTNQTITISITQPGGCNPITITFDVPPCNGGGEEPCPEITATVEVGDCNDANLRPVSVTYTVTNNTAGPVIVELVFAPGASGSANTILAGASQSFTETHEYDPAAGPATPVVNVLFPVDCPDVPLPAIALDPCGGGAQNPCPDITIDATPGPCSAAGLQTVSFTVTVVNNTGGVVIVENEFAPGTTGAAQVVPNGATHTYTEQHAYDPAAGAHTFTVNVLQPQGCPGASHSFFLKPCPSQGCTDPTIMVGDIVGCAGAGSSVSVQVTADLGGEDPTGCSFSWDSGIPGSVDVTTAVPTHTFVYDTPGTYSIGVIANCGDCHTLDTVTVEIPSCCPTEFESIHTNVQGCVDATNSATVTATVQPNMAGTYSWFLDGAFHSSNAAATSPAMTVNSAGDHTVAVEFVPAAPDGCPAITASTTFPVPACGEPGDGGETGGDGEGWGCIIGRWAGVILIGASLALFALIACIPAAAQGLAIAGGIAAALGALILILWAIFCPNKPCKWALLFLWQATLIAGLTLILFMDCCPTGAWVGAGLVAAAAALMATWASQCDVGRCRLLAEMSVAIATAVLPVVDVLSDIPVLNACLNPIAETAITVLAGLLAAAVAACVANEG